MISFHCYESSCALKSILVVHWDSQDLFCKAALYPVSSWLLYVFIISKLQDFTCALIELEDINVGSFLQLSKVPLSDSPALECISCSPQFDVIHLCYHLFALTKNICCYWHVEAQHS